MTDLPENLPQGSPVQVVYRFDESGRISVEAEEKTGGRSAKTEIERHGALDESKIDVLSDLAQTYRVEQRVHFRLDTLPATSFIRRSQRSPWGTFRSFLSRVRKLG